MKRNVTQVKRLTAGRPKRTATNKRTKNFAGVSTNYKMMLELYCLNKKEGLSKNELKYRGTKVPAGMDIAVKPSFSITTAIITFFEESLMFLKRSKPGMAMATVTEPQSF